jgi:glycosyltransferase involved in cell wall biosynthesis
LRDWLPLMAQLHLWRRWRGVFDLVVADSHALRARLVAEGLGPVETVWPGVSDTPRQSPLDQAPTVAFSGRLVPEKGVAVLLRAFAAVSRELPDARLLLAGEGPQREEIRQLVAALDLGAHARLLGHLRPQDVERELGGAWVQAVPSLWEEPFGLVAAEAQMRGTAVVASRTGGLPEIVRDGETGLLVPPGDEQALTVALVRVLRDRAWAERLGRAGRARALARFGEAAWVDRYLELYRSLVGLGAGTSAAL